MGSNYVISSSLLIFLLHKILIHMHLNKYIDYVFSIFNKCLAILVLVYSGFYAYVISMNQSFCCGIDAKQISSFHFDRQVKLHWT